MFVGVLLARRDRQAVALVAVPAAAVLAWGVVVRLAVQNPGEYIAEFGVPMQGIVESGRFWAQGFEPLGLIAFVVGLAAAVAALVRRGCATRCRGWSSCRSPSSWCSRSASWRPSATLRAVMPMMIFGLVMLATPAAARLTPTYGVRRLVAATPVGDREPSG